MWDLGAVWILFKAQWVVMEGFPAEKRDLICILRRWLWFYVENRLAGSGRKSRRVRKLLPKSREMMMGLK